jgi:hypothetical protein
MDDPREIARIRRQSRRIALAALAFGLLTVAAFVVLFLIQYLTQSPAD